MVLQQFLEKYNGQYVEVAGSANAKNQCVDLANAYLREVCNHPIVEWTNACDFPSKIKDMEWIPNNEESDLPQEGDVIIWSNKVGGGAGHIAIFIEGTTSSFKSFDQNWPLYSPCHVQGHTYSNVLGWIRPQLPIQDNMTEEQKRILDFIGNRTEGDVRQAFGALADLPNVTKEIEALKESQKDLVSRIEQLEADAKANNELIVDYQSQLSSAKSRETKLQAELKAQADEKNQWKNRYEQALKDQVNKYTGWQLVKMGINKLIIQKSK